MANPHLLPHILTPGNSGRVCSILAPFSTGTGFRTPDTNSFGSFSVCSNHAAHVCLSDRPTYDDCCPLPLSLALAQPLFHSSLRGEPEADAAAGGGRTRSHTPSDERASPEKVGSLPLGSLRSIPSPSYDELGNFDSATVPKKSLARDSPLVT